MNTKHFSITITILVVASILLTACGGQPEEVEPTIDVASVMAASVQQTVAAVMATQNSVPTAPPAPTATSAPLPLPTTSAPPPVVVPTSAPVSPNCWVADLISETVPDGTMFRKGETFTKEWRVINGGTCAWTTAYKFVFVDGYSMGTPAEGVPLPESVDRGMSTTVKIKMTAPNDIGTFNGNWVLKSDTGIVVGKFNVKITTGEKPFAVTRVSFGVESKTKDCPYDYSIPISITSDGSGIVDYDIYDVFDIYANECIDKTPGTAPDSSGKITFDSSGTKTINHSITYDVDSDIKVCVHIVKPNNQFFLTKEYDLTCNP